MHVLVLTSAYKSSFSSINALFFRDQALALKRAGHQVGLVCPLPVSFSSIWNEKRFDFTKEEYSDEGINTIVKPFVSFPKMPERTRRQRLKIGKKLFKEYREEHGMPVVVHVHTFLAGELAIWIKETYGVPFVVTEHSSAFQRGMLTSSHHQLAKKVFLHSDANIAVSESLSNMLAKMFSSSFSVIPNIVDTDYFIPLQRNKKSPYTFLNVAHLNKNKNQAMLIKAFAKFNKKHSETRLVILGGGEEMNSLGNLVKELNLSDKVMLFGPAGRSEVKEFMQLSDCFILPSIVETFGVVLIEAMACGLPVLASKCGGPESIVTKETGVLFENNEEALLSAINQMYNSNYSSEKIRIHAIEAYSETAVAKQVVKILQSV